MKNAGDISALQHENAQLRGDLLTVAMRVAHDLRAPLSGILSVAEALRECSDPATAKELTRSLIVSAEELSALIKDVSFVLKATANPVQKEWVKMDEVFSFALQRVEHRAMKHSASIVQPAAWPNVHGVPAWIEKIWSHLLERALRQDGNPLKIEVGWHDGEHEKKFWLRDGVVMPPEQRERLFQPFELLHKLNSPGGLNLAIIHRLVTLQGGRCGCDDTASIFFTLPS